MSSPDRPQLAHDCDVCIVGGGPTGLSLAQALITRGRTVVVLESGDRMASGSARDLSIATSSGDPFRDLRESRPRALGGAATIWTTIRHGAVGAKYTPLGAIDFEQRDITDGSGWPITRAELDPWYVEAATLCELTRYDPQQARTDAVESPLLPFATDGLISFDYNWGSADPFVRGIPDQLFHSPHAQVICGATVTRLVTAPHGERVTAVEWRSLTGSHGMVRASHFVLAVGAMENARLLLVLARNNGQSSSPWLGRGFMEHPIDRSLSLVSRHPALSPDPGFYAYAGTGSRAHLVGGIGLSDSLMRDQQLRNAAVRLFSVRYSRLDHQLRRLRHRFGRTPATTYRILLDLEQAPHPDNRVTLSPDVDPFGIPRAHLHWQWREADESFRQRLLVTIQREFSRANAGEISIAPGQPIDPDTHHHAGTTRMHPLASEGVVDRHLRVHGSENLFVCGASVFPTCGVANPTLTIVALALRLANYLTTGTSDSSGGPITRAQSRSIPPETPPNR